MGTSLDFYQRLNKLQPEVRDKLLTALRDVVFDEAPVEEFRTEPGWNTSVFRGDDEAGQPQQVQDNYLGDARAVLTGNYTDIPSIDEPIIFQPTGRRSALNVSFDVPALSKSWFSRDLLPQRGAVIIGPNGSGKSTMLSRLSRVAYASPFERSLETMSALGYLQPVGLGFFKIISVSYSAFDSFSLPGTYLQDLKQIVLDVERGDGRFVFCGLRDIAREGREDIERYESFDIKDADTRPLQPPERRPNIHLKSLDMLADEFSGYLNIIAEKRRGGLFEKALNLLLADQSFSVLPERSAQTLLGEDPRAAFMAWSTGHKIALHVIAALTAPASMRALVLYDEPESHLHPPMVAAMMHAIRYILKETDAMAIIATHSPVVLQETLARHVRVVRRGPEGPIITQPMSETFGENIGTLVHDTFGLRAGDTDFHELLDGLIAFFGSFEEIDALFEPGLSAQARAYVMARFADETFTDKDDRR
jgi:energy-coupling factor transporter ATP-binding protein EcfA2